MVPSDPLPGHTFYLLGLDLGESADHSALAVVRRVQHPQRAEAAQYAVQSLRRWDLHTPYRTVVEDVRQLLEQPSLAQMRCVLAMDKTGVGAPVVEMVQQADLPLPRLFPIFIHGGEKAREADGTWRVPKRHLASTLAVLLQARRLQIAPALPLAQTLAEELANFRVKIDPKTAHESFAAWREKEHDDLVLATALACWVGEQVPLELGRPTLRVRAGPPR